MGWDGTGWVLETSEWCDVEGRICMVDDCISAKTNDYSSYPARDNPIQQKQQ